MDEHQRRAGNPAMIGDCGLSFGEYDYADTTSNSRQADRDQGSVGSGNYNPGSSCP